MTLNEFYESLLGLSDIKIDNVKVDTKKIELHCHTVGGSHKCNHCKSELQCVHQYTERKVRDLDIVGKEVWLIIKVRQFQCSKCNKHTNEQLSFADPGKSYTMRQAKWVFDCCAQQPFSQVGALLNMCSKTVENLYYAQAAKKVDLKARYEDVTQIGIDEIAHRKGKGDYCCVISDLKRGTEIDILPDRKKETIIAYFKGLGVEICHRIKVVSCDIWATYITCAKECFPNVVVTIDRFHVVKALNDALDVFRKNLRKQYKDEQAYKKIKWTLFKQPKNCTEQDCVQLKTAFALSADLQKLYTLRNQFHTIYDNATSVQQMTQQLKQWVNQATATQLKCLQPFLKTLQNWMEPIATYALTKATNAVTEGLNNIIRYLKRISFGLPNFQHLRLRILANYT